MIPPRRTTSTATTITVNAAGLPAWAPNPGQFTYASTQTPNQAPGQFTPLDPNRHWQGDYGWAGIWAHWNGGIYAPTMGSLGSLYFFGGGHAGYFGGDVIRYDIANRVFSRAYGVDQYAQDVRWPPGNSSTGDTTNLVVTTRGNFVTAQNASTFSPYPCHTNNGIEFIPSDGGGGALGSLAFVMHNQSLVNINQPCVWLFDLAASTWSRGPDLAFPSVTGGDYGNHHGLTYDSRRKVLWIASGYGTRTLWEIDLVGGTNRYIANANFSSYAGSWVTLPNIVYIDNLDMIWLQSQGTSSPTYWGIDLSSLTTASGSINGLTRTQLTVANPTADPCYSNGNTVEAGQASGYVNALDIPATVYRGAGNATQLTRHVPPATNWKANPWTWDNETLAPKNAGETHQFETRPSDGDLATKARYVPAMKSIVYSHAASLLAVAARHSSWT
jgi:hypothetical protein